jgi:ribokinase
MTTSDSMRILILGGVIIDQYLMVESFPDRGGDVLVTDTSSRVGGCAVNVASTLKNLGLNAEVVSVIGDDERGRMIYEYLESNQLPTEAIRVAPGKDTGYCLSILEDSGERTFLTYKGCESEFRADLIDDAGIRSVSHVYVTGYYLVDAEFAPAVIEFVHQMKRMGATILFDPGALVDHIQHDLLLSMIKAADIVTPNLLEMDKIARTFHLDGDAGSWLLENGVGTLVQKMGDKGTTVRTHNQHFHVPSFHVTLRDTSGAGDSFAGGLIYALTRDFDLERAIGLASACGAMTTTAVGPHVDFTLNDILELMEGAGDSGVR